MDKELKSLADDYEKKMINMAFMEQQYGNVITRMLNERTDDKSVNNKLSKELTELQHRYEETSKELSIAEKTLSSNKVKQLNKKLKTSKNANKKNKAKLKKQQKQLNQATTELYYVKDELKEKEAEIKILKKEKQNLQSRIWQFSR